MKIVPTDNTKLFRVVGEGADFIGRYDECRRYMKIYRDKLNSFEMPEEEFPFIKSIYKYKGG